MRVNASEDNSGRLLGFIFTCIGKENSLSFQVAHNDTRKHYTLDASSSDN